MAAALQAPPNYNQPYPTASPVSGRVRVGQLEGRQKSGIIAGDPDRTELAHAPEYHDGAPGPGFSKVPPAFGLRRDGTLLNPGPVGILIQGKDNFAPVSYVGGVESAIASPVRAAGGAP